jgi:hypothetical protein
MGQQVNGTRFCVHFSIKDTTQCIPKSLSKHKLLNSLNIAMNEDELRDRLNLEMETVSINQLTELGNLAISMGLIAGHGFHGGKYEILRQGKAILLPANEAATYLEQLIQAITKET